jgi:transposase
LLLADGLSGPQIANKLGIAHPGVYKWGQRYRELGVSGLGDAGRAGRPSNITDEKIIQVVRTTIENKPVGATHWSTRDLAKNVGLNQTRISRIWRTFGLKPHLADTFQLSTDPEFVEKLRDVVGVYLHPPANAAVFCVDKKTQVQALNRTQTVLPSRPGMVERRTPE